MTTNSIVRKQAPVVCEGQQQRKAPKQSFSRRSLKIPVHDCIQNHDKIDEQVLMQI